MGPWEKPSATEHAAGTMEELVARPRVKVLNFRQSDLNSLSI